MNPIIADHFDAIESSLIQSAAVVSYHITRREIAATDGKLRFKASLSDGSSLEVFEYVSELEGLILPLKYSFHWQDAQEKLMCRWDNAPHYPQLPGAPHHVHNQDGSVSPSQSLPDAAAVLALVEAVCR